MRASLTLRFTGPQGVEGPELSVTGINGTWSGIGPLDTNDIPPGEYILGPPNGSIIDYYWVCGSSTVDGVTITDGMDFECEYGEIVVLPPTTTPPRP